MTKANDSMAAAKALDESFLAADASRHDEVRAQVAAAMVYVVGYQQGQFQEGRRWAKVADAVLQRLGGHELLRAWLLNDMAGVFLQENKPQAALTSIEKSLALKEKILGRDHPDVGIAEASIAYALHELGRDDEALAHNNRAVAVLARGLGSGHPDLAVFLSNGGEILSALERYREARESFDRARIIWEQELGPDNLNLGFALTGIGLTHLAEGHPSSGLDSLERAFGIRQVHEPEPSRRAETQFALARALLDSGRNRRRARVLAEEARDNYSKSAKKEKLAEVDAWLHDHAD
jgi:eukaryotic-like serine/threonine-protein kinase